jgi:hypothetical protein
MKSLLFASFLAFPTIALADIVDSDDGDDTDAGEDSDTVEDDSGCSTIPGGDVAAGVMLLTAVAGLRGKRRG